ncbi:hypothetical protein E1265_31610 [Streptomyces sp. 8K308]|uniref:DUF7919 family protein n=1 Tax=Streptomyces sp. 8K308 TaxID=2530388 RepID=UPI001048272A|nr:hypothetical protein [Streptomyces sp. 8K308]TDC10166.1 hypothetical protein E1265_31610 [Streptomyces sp. 8K308]
MTYYPDRSAYHYLAETVPADVTALNIGWLSSLRRYPKGEAPEGFTEALALLCRDQPRARTRGVHACGLPHRLGESRQPVRIEVGGEKVLLGTAEVRVIAKTGEWLIAPTLVHHYVTRHRYLPPPEFVEAVLAGRVAGEA